MKHWKKFYVLAILIAAIVLVIKYGVSIYNVVIVQGDDKMEGLASWNDLVIDGTNEKGISLIVDGNAIPQSESIVVMDNQKHLLLAMDSLTSLMSCAVHTYTDGLIRIEKANNYVLTREAKNDSELSEDELDTNVRVLRWNDRLYVDLPSFASLFGYQYSWDYETCTASMSNLHMEEKIYPYAYDYRNVGRIRIVKNQADLGTCWAFASLTSLETSLLPTYEANLSPDHMTCHNGYNINQSDGGEYTMSMAYLTSWIGPVTEEMDPYGDGYSPENLDAVYHVQEIQIIEGKNLDGIKKAVFLYGGVQSSLYMSVRDADGNASDYYDPDKYSYCYLGTEKPNHDVVIVGWDDSYSASNFSTVPEGDGAFICVNSWGEKFGDNGYFYVSYFDSNIAMHNLVYTRVDGTDNYDNLYQSDLCGWVGQLGYNRENAYFANVYEINDEQVLKAVGFYATGKGTSYDIYVVPEFENTSSFNQKFLVSKGTLENAGYYTIDLEKEVELKPGKCAVIVQISTPGATRPIAVEYISGPESSTVKIDDGEGYISFQGRQWERVEYSQRCNICLKMYTDNKKEEQK